MLAGLECGERRGKVQKVWEANDRRVNVRIFQQLSVIAVRFLRCEFLLKCAASCRIQICRRKEFRVLDLRERERVLLAGPASADYPKVEFCSSFSHQRRV